MSKERTASFSRDATQGLWSLDTTGTVSNHERMAMRRKHLDIFVAGATAVVALSLFLPWYRASFDPSKLHLPEGFSYPSGPVSVTTSALGGAAGSWRFLILIVCGALLAYLAFRLVARDPPRLPLTHHQLLLLGAGANILLVLSAFLVKPSPSLPPALAPAFSVSDAYGAFIGLVACILAFAGAAWSTLLPEASTSAPPLGVISIAASTAVLLGAILLAYFLGGGNGSNGSEMSVVPRGAPAMPGSPGATEPPSLPLATNATTSTGAPQTVAVPSGSSKGPHISAGLIEEDETSVSLPSGMPLYLYGFATGGAVPASDFAKGKVVSVVDASGNTAAEIAVSKSPVDSYTTSAIARAVVGIALSGFRSEQLTYGTNGSTGAASASDSFSVQKPGSLAVVVAMAGGEQAIDLSLPPDGKIVASSPAGSLTTIDIATATLGPGTYKATELTAPLAAGNNPANQADIIAVLVLSPGP